jgi:hypothetical protein
MINGIKRNSREIISCLHFDFSGGSSSAVLQLARELLIVDGLLLK